MTGAVSWKQRDRHGHLYSPRIRPELIPVLYHTAKAKTLPMTCLVDMLIYKALAVEPLPGEARTRLAGMDLGFLEHSCVNRKEVADSLSLHSAPAPFANEQEIEAWYSGAKQGLFRLHELYEKSGAFTDARRAELEQILELLTAFHTDARSYVARPAQ